MNVTHCAQLLVSKYLSLLKENRENSHGERTNSKEGQREFKINWNILLCLRIESAQKMIKMCKKYKEARLKWFPKDKSETICAST